jgi:hypothetical protein
VLVADTPGAFASQLSQNCDYSPKKKLKYKTGLLNCTYKNENGATGKQYKDIMSLKNSRLEVRPKWPVSKAQTEYRNTNETRF